MIVPASGAGTSALRTLLRLALPIIGVNVGLMLMGTVDTVMVGRLSAQALAAVALGNVIFFALSIFVVGVLLATDPIISQAVGANDRDGVALGVQRGAVLAILLSIPVGIALCFAGPALRLAGQPDDVIPLAATYCLVLVPGLVPFFLFNVGRQALQSLHRVGPVLWTIVAANIVNVALNEALIFGKFGAPALGVAGSAWATSISRLLMAPMLVWLARDQLMPTIRPWRPEATSRGPLMSMFRIGAPIGLQLELEMSAFAAVALLMGTFGTTHVAGHQIAINLASLTFMVPMGVAMGAAVLAGNAVGRGDHAGLRAAAKAALLVGFGFMSLTALALIAMPTVLARVYTRDMPVLLFAATLLPIAGVFQVFDGLQVVGAGILRGIGDTHVPMIINLAGFIGVGLTSSYVLAYHTPLGPVGLWWGLVIGLAAVATILMLRVRHALRAPVERLES